MLRHEGLQITARVRNSTFDELVKRFPRLVQFKSEFPSLVDTVAFYKIRWLYQGKDLKTEFDSLIQYLNCRYSAERESKYRHIQSFANLIMPQGSKSIPEEYVQAIYEVFCIRV